MSTNPSPSGVALGLTMYREEASKAHKAKKEAKAKSSSKSSGDDLESGTLNGTLWSHEETRDELYQFAKGQGLAVKSRDSKTKIIKALSDATKAQG